MFFNVKINSMKKKFLKSLGLLFVVGVFAMNLFNSEEDVVNVNVNALTEAEAGNSNCTNDKSDNCGVYGTNIKDCDEAFWSNNCKEDQNCDPGDDGR